MSNKLNYIIKCLNRHMYALQKVRIACENRVTASFEDDKDREAWVIRKKRSKRPDPSKFAVDALEDGYWRTLEEEAAVARQIRKFLVDHPAWIAFLQYIGGISTRLGSSLITEIYDIGRFPTVSSLWAYFGLTSQYVVAKCKGDPSHKLIMASDKNVLCPVMLEPDGPIPPGSKPPICNSPLEIIERVYGKAPRPTKGYHYLFNTKAKKLAFKIAEQMATKWKQGPMTYQNVYQEEIKRQTDLHPEITVLHAKRRAMRKMTKIFLSNLWEEWRKAEGLPVREPYVFDKLEGHTHYINPMRTELAGVRENH